MEKHSGTHAASLIFTARAEALFASHLSVSATVARADVITAIRTAVRCNGGSRGCAGVMAAEYGRDPECAAARMRWARGTVAAVYGR